MFPKHASAKLSYAPRMAFYRIGTRFMQPRPSSNLRGPWDCRRPVKREIPGSAGRCSRSRIAVPSVHRFQSWKPHVTGTSNRGSESVSGWNRRAGGQAESVMDEKRVRGIEGSLQWCEGSNQPVDEHVLPAGTAHRKDRRKFFGSILLVSHWGIWASGRTARCGQMAVGWWALASAPVGRGQSQRKTPFFHA